MTDNSQYFKLASTMPPAGMPANTTDADMIAQCSNCKTMSPQSAVLRCECANKCIVCVRCASVMDECLNNTCVTNYVTINNPANNYALCSCPMCGWQGKLAVYENHYYNECPNAVVLCPHPLCCRRYFRCDAAKHWDECKYVNIPCLQCTALIRRDQMDVHKQECPESDWVCNKCDCKELLKNRIMHVSNTCTERIVQCYYAHFGCNDTYPFSKQATHEENNLRKHADLLKAHAKQLKQPDNDTKYTKTDTMPSTTTGAEQPVNNTKCIETVTMPPATTGVAHQTVLLAKKNIKLETCFSSSTVALENMHPGSIMLNGKITIKGGYNKKYVLDYENIVFAMGARKMVVDKENLSMFGDLGGCITIDFACDIIYL